MLMRMGLADGSYCKFDYNALGQSWQLTLYALRRKGGLSSYTYDAVGRVMHVSNPTEVDSE